MEAIDGWGQFSQLSGGYSLGPVSSGHILFIPFLSADGNRRRSFLCRFEQSGLAIQKHNGTVIGVQWVPGAPHENLFCDGGSGVPV
jgi:hypothetical protein